VAVEPVKLTMSTRGFAGEQLADGGIARRDDVEHTGRDVGVLGDQPAEGQAAPRRLRRRLQHHGAAGGQRRSHFGQVDLVGHVPRGDGGDHPDGVALGPTLGRAAQGVGDAERRGPLVALGQIGVVGEKLGGGGELHGGAGRAGRTHLGDRQLGELVGVLDERLMELAKAPHPELDVAGPAALVECTPGGGQRRLHVGGGGVGGHAQLPAGRRVLHRIGGVVLGAAQRAVDQQPLLVPELGGGFGAHSRVTCPPSTATIWPVIQDASSDSRNSTGPTWSAGVPRRLIARLLTNGS
jgi:hypothetical protein